MAAGAGIDEGALRDCWAASWRELGSGSGGVTPSAGALPAEALFAELLARHREAHRAYHTLQHLAECFVHLEREREHALRPAEVALAIWFHDAIYEVHRHDNEERSAEWARAALLAAGAPAEVAARVQSLVLATRHAEALAEDGDAPLLIDIDLAILGATEARFAEYEAQIRIEYAHVPREAFEARRRGILAGFLAREPIYRTASMRERFEGAARRNLARAISAPAPRSA